MDSKAKVANVLHKADEVTSKDRNRYYGHPLDNHTNTAAFWSAYIGRKFGVNVSLTARDVCMMMVLLKVSRDANKENEDNLIDICGYARNAEMVNLEAEKRGTENSTRLSNTDFSLLSKSKGHDPFDGPKGS